MTYYPGSSLLSLSSLSLSIHISIYLSSYLILSYSPSNPPTFCLSFSLLFYIPKFCLSHTNTSSLSIYISTHLPLPSIYLSISPRPQSNPLSPFINDERSELGNAGSKRGVGAYQDREPLLYRR